ncbi:hypothetical protein SEA_MOLLYMUR_81 [Gordonia phage Mollymur]|uniref:Uncharacterized protein n=1 Tax=Gordonia phage Mollymur TaxID=2590895 RepID=A0A4Y6E9U1_9CAUD|nr:hypothetical protein PQB84_gp045 [Gordonia phage Mollymur]QDF15441.1 hypothetical protein SEA_MOLLYMUR_81 [Gordonia phage Mollymur]
MIETRRGEIRQSLIKFAGDMADEIRYYARAEVPVRIDQGVRDEIEQALRTIFSKLEIPDE